MDIGNQIRVARVARGLSQQQLAAAAGVSVRTLRSIERGTTGRPHRHSLEGIARAFGFTAAQTTAFLAACAPDPNSSRMTGVVGRPLDIDAYLGAGRGPLNSATRVVSSNARLRFGQLRRSEHLEHDLLLEARSRQVDQHWLLWGDDPSLDLENVRARVTIGGNVGALVVLPDHGLVALRVVLDPPLRRGEIHQLGVHWDFPHHRDATSPPDTEFAMGWRDVPHLTTVSVSFAASVPPPRRLWTIAGPNPTGLRVQSPISLDPTGTASVTRHVDAAGMVGIRWDWA